MSATLKLYIDRLNQRMVQSPSSGSGFTLPQFTQANVLNVQVQVLDPDPGSGANAFTFPDISNMALEAAMATAPTGASVDAPFMTSYAWTKDVVNHLFTATFDFTSALVDAAIGSSLSISPFLEFAIIEGTSKSRLWAGLVTLNATLFKNVAPGGLPAGQVGLTLAAASQMFTPFKLQPGGTITLVSPDGNSQRIVGVRNDGTAQDDLI